MATRNDFSADEWEAISDGPVYAGMMMITASKGGTFRETFSMSKAWAEARQRQGESELLDAIVAEKPKLEEKPGSAIELHKAGIQMLRQAAQAIEATSPDELGPTGASSPGSPSASPRPTKSTERRSARASARCSTRSQRRSDPTHSRPPTNSRLRAVSDHRGHL